MHTLLHIFSPPLLWSASIPPRGGNTLSCLMLLKARIISDTVNPNPKDSAFLDSLTVKQTRYKRRMLIDCQSNLGRKHGSENLCPEKALDGDLSSTSCIMSLFLFLLFQILDYFYPLAIYNYLLRVTSLF